VRTALPNFRRAHTYAPSGVQERASPWCGLTRGQHCLALVPGSNRISGALRFHCATDVVGGARRDDRLPVSQDDAGAVVLN
jgi:hypothetical protein